MWILALAQCQWLQQKRERGNQELESKSLVFLSSEMEEPSVAFVFVSCITRLSCLQWKMQWGKVFQVSFLLVKGGEKSPKLMNFAGSGPQWVLVAALCRAVCCFPYQSAGALGTDCWKGIKKLPDKLFFCWKKKHRRLKHFYSDSGTCFQKKEGFSCYTEPLTHDLQWRKVEHSSCHLSFPVWALCLLLT